MQNSQELPQMISPVDVKQNDEIDEILEEISNILSNIEGKRVDLQYTRII